MTDFTRYWIAKREQLEQAATEGPWCAEYGGEQEDCVIPHDAESTREAVATTRLYRSGADAEFIADARTSLPAALTALKAVLEQEGPRATGNYSEFSDGYHYALDACRDVIEATLRRKS